MKSRTASGTSIPFSVLMALASSSTAQITRENIPYLDDGHPRHVLDIFAPEDAAGLPVVFWIHGGGWQVGDKDDVQVKPRYFNEKGYVFVSTKDLGTQGDAATAALEAFLSSLGKDR